MTTLPLLDWDLRAARRGTLDGTILLGAIEPYEYHMPSCPLIKGPRKSYQAFPSEAMAKAAGLKACRVCKPQRIYAIQGDGLDVFERLSHQLDIDPASVGSPSALIDRSGLSEERLAVVLGDHAHATVDEWLTRKRVMFAARLLLGDQVAVSHAGNAAGFIDGKAFERTFVALMGMTPVEYGALGSQMDFAIRLPAHFRKEAVLAYQGRDAEGLAERSDSARVWKALDTIDGPAIVEIRFVSRMAQIQVAAPRRLSRAAFAALHQDVLKILGLRHDIRAFEAAHPALVAGREGLRIPLIPRAFDALCWAIIGQQINLSFAGSLRRDLIALAGERVGNMVVHPTPEAVANLDASDLTSRRFSRSKARYLIETAKAIVSGALPIEALADGSAVQAEARLTALHGIGVWTARYVMMRIGFADAAPVGDSGLATALERLYKLADRPDSVATARLMTSYAPWRSLASMHLWASL